MKQDRIDYFQAKTNGAVFDKNCNQLTELDYPDLYYYDRDAALWACEYMETNGKIVEDGHNFTKGDSIELLDWQIQTNCNLYGVKQKKNKLRRYWYVLQLLPKKQGKSPFSALNGIYLTSADGQGRGQIFTIAGDKMQAKIIHENAKEMIKDSPFLSKNLIIRRDHIEHPSSSSTFWVTSAVEDTKHGPNLSAIFEDEPHVYKDGELDKTLLKGIIARPEPVVMYTSTAGVRGCWFHVDKYAYAKNVLNKVHRDDRWLVFIYEADVDAYTKKYGDTWDDDQTPWWAQEQVWKDVNPSYGVTVTKDYFDNQVTLIKNKPDELNAFLRLHLNVFTGTVVEWSIVRQLLEHSAGLGDLSKKEWDHNIPLPLKDALALDPDSRHLRWPPGLHSSYSNSGAGVAAYAMEQATGLDFEDYLKSRVFAPLKMRSASLRLSPALETRLARGYDRDGRTPIPYWHTLYRPFAGINVELQEMQYFLQMLLGGGRLGKRQVFSAASIARMESPQTTLAARAGLTYGYGLGNYHYLHQGFVFHGHGGDADGYLSHYGYNRDRNMGYFLVINAFQGSTLRRMRNRTEGFIVAGLKPSYVPGIPQPVEHLQALAGDYRAATRRFAGPPEGRISVAFEDGRLYLKRSDRVEALIPLSRGQFRRRHEPVATTAFIRHDGQLYLQGPFGNYVRSDL